VDASLDDIFSRVIMAAVSFSRKIIQYLLLKIREKDDERFAASSKW
jgi:hypothetical protein